MLNIIVESEALGWAISRVFYQLSRPDSVRNSNDVSQFYCHVEQNPKNGYWYLRLPQGDRFPMSSQATTEAIEAILQPFVDQGIISTTDVANVRQGILTHQGGYTSIEHYIPQFWINSAVPDSDFNINT